MVLVIGDSKINREITIDELYNNFPKLSTDGAKFASTPIREVNGSDGVLYIRQKEDVVTFHKDRLSFILLFTFCSVCLHLCIFMLQV